MSGEFGVVASFRLGEEFSYGLGEISELLPISAKQIDLDFQNLRVGIDWLRKASFFLRNATCNIFISIDTKLVICDANMRAIITKEIPIESA